LPRKFYFRSALLSGGITPAFVAISQPIWDAQGMFYGFVAARAADAIAYASKHSHKLRSVLFTIGSGIAIAMALWALIATI
jgi:glutathione S-transferase